MSSAMNIIDAMINQVSDSSELDDHFKDNIKTNMSDQTTLYSKAVTSRFAQVKHEMHWLYDGLQSTVLSQLEALHQSSSLEPSTMKVLDVACGDGNYSRAISDRFGYHQIVGVEKSKSQLELANRLTPQDRYPHITYRQMAVGETTEEETATLKGTFDVVLAIWLYNYAESKNDLLEFIRWTNTVLKPGGRVIAVVPSIENILEADIGDIKGDPRFQTQQYFANGLREGLYLCKEGTNGTMQHNTHVYTYNTYDTLLEVSGFKDIRFLKDEEYKHDATRETTQRERDLFAEYMAWKGSCTGIFTATKM